MGRGAGSGAVWWGVAGLLSMFAPTTLHAQTGLTRDEVLRLPAQL